MDLVNRMIRYLVAENCAMSTIKTYSNALILILKSHPDFENYNSEKLVLLLSEIKDPIYRSNIRNVVLKVHRDMLGKQLNIPFVKKPERLQGVYTYEEVKLIFSKIHNAKHLAIARLLYVEGFRVGEVIGALLCDCNKADSSILIRSTKNKKDYKKYLDPSTIQALSDYCAWITERRIKLKKYLFEGVDSNQYSRRSIQEFMRKAIKDAGLPIKGSCHVFRRSSSVWKLESGWDVKYIAASLNNSPKTVEKYYALVRPDYLKTLPKPVF
jgi:integrase/recombinase XerD